jgi:glucose/arabinose dehydrogenase
MYRPTLFLCLFLIVASGCGAPAGQLTLSVSQAQATARGPTEAAVSTAVPVVGQPGATATVIATPAPLLGRNSAPVAREIQLPSGFRAYTFFQGLDAPTSLAFGPDDRLYVAEQSGRILSLANVDGQGQDERLVANAGGTVLGIAFRPNTGDLYISVTGRVLLARNKGGGAYDQPIPIVTGLPTGRHQNDQIAFLPDGSAFFLGIGSTCDACMERDPRSASIMLISADGKEQQVYAHGLRNPFGLAIHPQTGELFATDNGRDVPVSGVPDELNVIVKDGHYGWPDCWGSGQGTRCAGTLFPVALLQEHSSADGFAFYASTGFPAEYHDNAFVAEWGGNVPLPSIGKRVVRVVLTKANGQWQGTVSDFGTGFDHPITVAVGPQDSALYVADHGTGEIYRIMHIGNSLP